MPDFTVIPSIDQLRLRPAVRALEARFGAEATVDALRAAAAEVRGAIAGGDAARLRDLFQLVGGSDATEVLIDDRPVPYARELWLPLVWFLIPR